MNPKQLEPAHSFFYAPTKLTVATPRDAAAALARVKAYAADPPNDRQTEAIGRSFANRHDRIFYIAFFSPLNKVRFV